MSLDLAGILSRDIAITTARGAKGGYGLASSVIYNSELRTSQLHEFLGDACSATFSFSFTTKPQAPRSVRRATKQEV
jgi:hypothetical protein